MLPDLLKEGLKLVICSGESGEEAWYADPGNRLWDTLHTVGLVPRELTPSEWQALLEYGIGLVELAAMDPSGRDRGVRFEGGTELRRKVRQFAPRMLCFNGKQAAKDYLQMPTVAFGPLPHAIGTTKLFVCPTTKAGAKGTWDPRWWDVMARLA